VQGDEKKKLGNKTESEIKKILEKASRDCDIAVFTGGEPTIRNDLAALVHYAQKLGFKTMQIQSNARMFSDEKFCKKIIKAGANEFALALHGHIPALHNWLTGSDSFTQTVRGIKNLKRLKQRVITNTVITKSNYRHLPEIAKLLIGMDVDQFQFAFVHALGAAAKNFDSIVPRMSMIAPYLRRALAIGKYFKKEAMVEAVPFCFLAGFENCVSENVMPDMKIFDFKFTVSDFKKARMTEGKAKGPRCKKCKFFKVCEGPWKEYPEKFGWNEFKPVLK
jgi:MoaA/NifB/PqqE/SkfB family radical SAM enzyme